MSKSKGNVVTPVSLLEQFGSDAVRYWAVSARPGVDTAFDEGQMKVGRRLAIKILNASKFALGVMGEDALPVDAVSEPLDGSLLQALDLLVVDATTSFANFDYARALEATERFFWNFCDDYVELVKQRAYGSRGEHPARSARKALDVALSAVLRLFAPHMPFVTEEVWSWLPGARGSIHRAPWPLPGSGAPVASDSGVYASASAVLGEIRKAKSEAKRSQRAEVSGLIVRDVPSNLRALEAAIEDVQEAGSVTTTPELVASDSFAVVVTLTDPE
jgi:valyl-tRNA synthetase